MKGSLSARWGYAAIAVAVAAVQLAAAAPPAHRLQALTRLEPGMWQIRDLDSARPAPQSICVADPDVLIQLEHKQASCSRFVIANSPDLVTVHYTCPGNGFGRTSIRVETPRLAQIDTQGIADNIPFAYRAEARRMGICSSQKSAAR